MNKFEKVFAVVALLTITAAWFIGSFYENNNLERYASDIFPDANKLVEVYPEIFSTYVDSSLVGYVSFAEGNGYGGPLKAAVQIDTSGVIQSVKIVSSKETFAFYQKVLNGDLIDSFTGRKIDEQLITGENIDVVSGATFTSKAIIKSVVNSNYKIALNVFDINQPEIDSPALVFGIREILVILIIVIGLIGFFLNIKIKKILRWVSLISSLLVLGFIYTIPMSLTNINSFLMGYWPDWHEQLYWYLLFGVVLLPALLKGVNPYCTNICPFGAAQECLGVVGGSKVVIKGKPHTYLRWLQRILAWGLIVFALVGRNPGIQSHEVFGAFFALTGTLLQLILMAFVVITALFAKRPWCNYLCPVQAVTDYVKFMRSWLLKKT